GDRGPPGGAAERERVAVFPCHDIVRPPRGRSTKQSGCDPPCEGGDEGSRLRANGGGALDRCERHSPPRVGPNGSSTVLCRGQSSGAPLRYTSSKIFLGRDLPENVGLANTAAGEPRRGPWALPLLNQDAGAGFQRGRRRVQGGTSSCSRRIVVVGSVRRSSPRASARS